MSQLGQSILDYAASGKSPYTVTTLMSSIEPLLAHGYSIQALSRASRAWPNSQPRIERQT